MKKIKKVLLGFSILTAFNIFSVNSFAMKQNNNGKIIENNSKNNCINTNIKKKKYILGNNSKNNHINTNVKRKKYLYPKKNNDLNEAINTQQPSINSYETHEQKLEAIDQEFGQKLEAVDQELEACNSYETWKTCLQKLKILSQELKEFGQNLEAANQELEAVDQEYEQSLEAFNPYNEDEYFEYEDEDEENNSLNSTMCTKHAYDEE